MSAAISPELADSYGAIVFLNIPAGVEIGVDYSKWKPPKEREIWVMCAMRPGAHFVYWNRDEKMDSTQYGEFVYLSNREVVVYRWCTRFFLRVYDEDEIARYQLGHDNLSLLSRAVAYPAELVQPWIDVSFAVSRVSILLFQGKPLVSTEEDELEEYVENKEDVFDERPGQCFGDRLYSDIPNKIKQREAPGKNLPPRDSSAISLDSMDRSSDLEKLLEQYTSLLKDATGLSSYDLAEFKTLSTQLKVSETECLLLSELQMAYIFFLLGASMRSQVQWKELLILLGNCECLAESRSNLGAEVLRLMYGQISQIPDDFILSEISRSNFLIWTLMSLSEMMRDAEVPKLRRRLKILEDVVTKKFKMSIVELWALQEDGPQIVDVVEGKSND